MKVSHPRCTTGSYGIKTLVSWILKLIELVPLGGREMMTHVDQDRDGQDEAEVSLQNVPSNQHRLSALQADQSQFEVLRWKLS